METTMVRLKNETVDTLKRLKLLERESYDEVINRLLANVAEEHLELNSSVQKLISNRFSNLAKGKVYSTNDMKMILRDKASKKKTNNLKGCKDANRN